MIKHIFSIFSCFALILLCGCYGTDCNHILYRQQLKERMQSPNCIKVYDTIDNRVHIEVIDTITKELLDKKVKLLK